MTAQNARETIKTLRQSDLSRLAPTEMSAEERAELQRRYDNFVRHFGKPGPAAPARPAASRQVKKWQPGRAVATP